VRRDRSASARRDEPSLGYAARVLLAHDHAGTGSPVVLLHSWACDRRMFTPQWEPLIDAGHHVVRVDFRGFGDTPAATEPYSDADDLRVVVDAIGLDQVALVGSSGSGMVAQEFAARWPERVSRLMLLCTAGAGQEPTPDISEFWQRERELLAADDLDGAVELNVRTLLGPAADAATRALMAQMQRHTFEVQLAAPEVEPIEADYDLSAITAQTVVVVGGHDLRFFAEIADRLLTAVPAARRVGLDWAGHLPSLEDPARFNPVLLDFLG
jgi:pimeloyl-ACP methyl ester carboxylesterase